MVSSPTPAILFKFSVGTSTTNFAPSSGVSPSSEYLLIVNFSNFSFVKLISTSSSSRVTSVTGLSGNTCPTGACNSITL